jgi:hypothetical protein
MEFVMAAPTPIHRDPEVDGDDYGCVGRNRARGNAAVAKLVADAADQLKAGGFADGGELFSFVHAQLKQLEERHACGSCDTIVKENIFAALGQAMAKAGIEIDQMDLYGW